MAGDLCRGSLGGEVGGEQNRDAAWTSTSSVK